MVINYTSRGRCIDAKLYLNIKLDLQNQMANLPGGGGWRCVDKLIINKYQMKSWPKILSA